MSPGTWAWDFWTMTLDNTLNLNQLVMYHEYFHVLHVDTLTGKKRIFDNFTEEPKNGAGQMAG